MTPCFRAKSNLVIGFSLKSFNVSGQQIPSFLNGPGPIDRAPMLSVIRLDDFSPFGRLFEVLGFIFWPKIAEKSFWQQTISQFLIKPVFVIYLANFDKKWGYFYSTQLVTLPMPNQGPWVTDVHWPMTTQWWESGTNWGWRWAGALV